MSTSKIKKLPVRSDVPVEFTWDLSPVFPDDETWEKAYQNLEKEIPKFSQFRKKLAQSPEILCSCLDLESKTGQILEKLSVYANLKVCEDITNTKFLALAGRVQYLSMLLAQAVSFIAPEIQSIPDKKFQEFLSSKELKKYRFSLENLRRFKPHVLSEKEEYLLALHTESAGGAGKIFEQLNDADLKFGTITDAKGNKVELTHGNFRVFLENRDRNLRKKAFFQYYNAYEEHANTMSASLSASVLEDVFHARARKYNSVLESALFEENIPSSVYHNLLNAVKENITPLVEYLQLRKQVLGIKNIHAYDLLVPLIDTKQRRRKYEEAVKDISSALAPLGKEYTQTLEEGLLKKRWVDRYENKGKRSGAFSWGCYRCPPYILMNYKDELEDSVFTLAHEAGHSMHSYFSDKKQPFHYSHYTIFVAEVASTVNEQLLVHYYLQKLPSKEDRIRLICREIDEIRTTLIRQTMFAEFELKIHTLAEHGQPLTLDVLRSEYRNLLNIYFGGALTIDPQLELECLRIPHFYHAFYVYKYATGISSAIAIAKKLIEGDKETQKDYLEFLSMGGFRYPLEQLKSAGVDLSTPEPIQTAMNHLGERVSQLKELLLK